MWQWPTVCGTGALCRRIGVHSFVCVSNSSDFVLASGRVNSEANINNRQEQIQLEVHSTGHIPTTWAEHPRRSELVTETRDMTQNYWKS